MTDPTGGRAFPNDGAWANNVPEGGMSLRDYFAAAALTGGMGRVSMKEIFGNASAMVGFARDCFAVADAMLQERNKTNGA